MSTSFEKLSENTEKSAGNTTTMAIMAGVDIQRLKGEIKSLPDGKPFLIHRDQQGLEKIVDISYLAAAPIQIEKFLTFTDVPSFNAYVNEFKDDGSKIFVNADIHGASIKAILDYHHAARAGALGQEGSESSSDVAARPRWGRHIAEYAFPTTPEWKELLQFNRTDIKQLPFAEMVERLASSFKEPDAATMLEIARTLEAKSESIFKSGITLQNGDRELEFKTKTEASAGRSEKIQIPPVVVLNIQPFVRGTTFQVNAMLRYKVRDGAVTFQYDIIKPHEFIDFAVKEIVENIKTDTRITPLFAVVS